MYAQFLVDLALLTIAFAMIAGLPSFFHLLLLLVIIPCTILAPFCGMLLASLASGAHLWLVSLMAQPAGWAEIVGPIFIFVMAADQCRFYGRRLAAKTRQAEESTWIAEALLRVAGELTAEPTRAAILQRIAALARELAGAPWAGVLKLEADGQTFRLGGMASRTGFLDEEMLQIDVPPRREFLARLAAAPDGCTEVRSPEESIIAEWLHERWRAGGYLAAALCRGNDTIGILVVGSDAGGTFSATATRRLVVGMARQTALALDNARLREQAEAASALKSQFISMMSHELRSPMHAIIGYTAMLTEESDDLSGGAAETRREMLERVRIQSCQLLEIIEASLDVNRLEAGRISVTRTPIALDSLFEQMVASVPEYWLKPDVHLVWDVQPLPTVETDGPKVKLIVFKLVQNALKFTDHGEVRIAVWADDTTPGADADGILRITVSDTGIGMAPELVPRMFDMFRQGDGSFTRRHGGVGLGLYIVRRLVELLDGTIDVVSAPGEGSRFAVSMPFRTPVGRPAPALKLGAAPSAVPLLH